jgi:hypothetical protein
VSLQLNMVQPCTLLHTWVQHGSCFPCCFFGQNRGIACAACTLACSTLCFMSSKYSVGLLASVGCGMPKHVCFLCACRLLQQGKITLQESSYSSLTL